MSLEQLINKLLRQSKEDTQEHKWGDHNPAMHQGGPGSHQHPQPHAARDDYALPENKDELPEFIRNELNNPSDNGPVRTDQQQRQQPQQTPPPRQSQQPRRDKGRERDKNKPGFWRRYLGPLERNRPDKPEVYRPWYIRALRFTGYWSFIGAIWGALLLVIAVTIYALISPDPLKAGLKNKPAYLSIVASNGKVIAEKGLRRSHVKLEEMPDHVVNAVLATEDRRFYYHPGLDPIGIIRATIQNRRAGRIVQGGSTITQQLAKVLFLKPARNYWRKAEEMLLAFWLEYRFSKKQILELYLNRIYFGAGNYGIEAAAQHYFGKSIADVSVYEAAILAGLIKSPSYYAPTRNFERSLKRARVVMKLMHDSYFLNFKEYEEAKALRPVLRSYLPSESYGYIIDWVVERVSAYGQNLQEDMVVKTTIDYELQGVAQKVVRDNLTEYGPNYNAKQGAAVILDKNGAVKALVGGKNYRKNQFNRIVKAKRQPGSTFKPFIFLAAMEKGMRPDSEVRDAPIRIGDWSPKNYNNRFYGDVTLRYALAKSLNTVSVRLSEWVGRDRVIQTAHRLGINTRLKNNPSIALGTSEVSPLEITAAYVPFANGGYAVQPHIISKVTDKAGNVLYSYTSQNWGRVIRSNYVSAMNDMLTATVQSGTAKQAKIEPHQSAGKTGTGQGYRDAWFIGYTGHLVGGVWIGNDDFKPMKKATGGALPTMIWRDIMQFAHLNKQPVRLPGGNWENSSDEWGEDRPRRKRRSFWDSLFGGDSGDDYYEDPREDTRKYRRRRQQEQDIWDDIFDGG